MKLLSQIYRQPGTITDCQVRRPTSQGQSRQPGYSIPLAECAKRSRTEHCEVPERCILRARYTLQYLVGDFVDEGLFISLVEVDFGVDHGIVPFVH